VLFSTLGEEGLLDRLANSNTRVIITRKSLLRKILSINDKLPSLIKILVIDLETHQDDTIQSLDQLLVGTGTDFDYPHTLDSETPAFLQYTSGSTGKPKGGTARPWRAW